MTDEMNVTAVDEEVVSDVESENSSRITAGEIAKDAGALTLIGLAGYGLFDLGRKAVNKVKDHFDNDPNYQAKKAERLAKKEAKKAEKAAKKAAKAVKAEVVENTTE